METCAGGRKTLNIVCFRWGSWDDEYVYRLKNMIERHLTLPYNFICFSDRPVKNVNWSEIPKEALNLNRNFTKLWVYSENNGLHGRTILFDLDMVIIGSLDEMLSYSGDWCGIRGLSKESKPKVGGGLLSFDHDKFHYIWDNRDQYKHHRGNERFVYGEIFKTPDTWQDLYPNQLASYKWGRPFHENMRIIAFHGKPRPHQVTDKIILENWR